MEGGADVGRFITAVPKQPGITFPLEYCDGRRNLSRMPCARAAHENEILTGE
jgi:hypothetical protein